jgi:rhodanese-related sulfurtransferase
MPTDIMEIDATKLKRMQMLHVRFILLDVRTAEQYSQSHIDGAIHIEAKQFEEKLSQMVPKKDTPIIIYDQDGITSAELVSEAEKRGYINIVNLEGGYQAYTSLDS